MKIFKNNQLSFWRLQIIGWISFEILSISRYFFYQNFIINTSLDNEKILLVITNFLICDSFNFGLTIVLRYFYRILFKKNISIKSTILLIIICSFLMSIISQIFDLIIDPIIWPKMKVDSVIILKGIYSASVNVVLFIAWSGLYFGIKNWIYLNIEMEKVEKANYLAQQAQLQMLRYQINPHFLFNSLNSVSALIEEDKKKSKIMLHEISSFLRASLENRNLSMIPLKEELNTIQLYLSIEKKRFEEKIKIVYNIENQTLEFPVLSFILHPIVENAIKYGLKTSSLPLQINIQSVLNNKNLIITITNSGKWIEPNNNNNISSTGIGLENVKQRIYNSFPLGSELSISHNENEVTVRIFIKTSK